MSEPRLKTGFFVAAHIRRCEGEGIAAMLVRRGAEEAGDLLIKLNYLDGRALVFTRTTLGDGTRAWMRAPAPDPVAEADADAYIQRRLKQDPDIWILEIEDRHGRHLLDDKVV
ncbi:MAG: DUF1491 family protein [Alphaproteobacteria bacterium]|nr:DUF1491 family protein [Alphaproteobacteria bacterium]